MCSVSSRNGRLSSERSAPEYGGISESRMLSRAMEHRLRVGRQTLLSFGNHAESSLQTLGSHVLPKPMATLRLDDDLPVRDDRAATAARRTLAKCLRDVAQASEDESLSLPGCMGLIRKVVGH